MQNQTTDTCGIPSKANWHTQVIFSHRGETSYTDVYSCDQHFPGYSDGSMSADDAASMLLWDGHDQAEILEWESTHLRTTDNVSTVEFGMTSMLIDHGKRTVRIFADNEASERATRRDWRNVCAKLIDLSATRFEEIGMEGSSVVFTAAF